MRYFILGLFLSGVSLFGAPAADDPIVVPAQAAPVDLPGCLAKAVGELGLKTDKVSIFHDQRNILELSYYGNRRGVPGPDKTMILIEKGLKRFWLADRFPHPEPTTIVGPFKGNAIVDLKLRSRLKSGDYTMNTQAISGLLSSGGEGLTRFGLEAIPGAMNQRVDSVHSAIHFLERRLPSKKDDFVRMNLGKETEAALQSMNQARERIKAVTVQPAVRTYQAGYDPTRKKRNGIGVLPEEAWGEAKKGLQAALATPATLRLNEKSRVYFVFRNISRETLRVSLPGITGNLRLTYEATPHLSYGGTEGVGGLRQALTHWVLNPGEQAMVVCRDLQIMKKGGVIPRLAYENGSPGKMSVWASSGSSDEWDYHRDREPRLIAVPEGEWKGHLKTGKRGIGLLADEVPYRVAAPRELGLDHGLTPVSGFPEGLDYHRSSAIEIRQGIRLSLNHKNDAHWLQDSETHRGTLFWGPLTSGDLQRFGLFDPIEKDTRALLANQPSEPDASFFHLLKAQSRLSFLIQGSRPFAEMGLRFALGIEGLDSKRIGTDSLLRAIRDRRVELHQFGLEKELKAALDFLERFEPPLPPADQFAVIAQGDLPPTLKDEAWGPENEGLRAAALMPTAVEDGTTADVRLFLRNVSDREIFLTVSNRGGYDYAIATDAQGNSLPAERPIVYSSIISSRLRREINPGQLTQNPPVATLTKLRLEAGAIYELKTRTALTYQSKVPGIQPTTISFEGEGSEGNPATTVVTAPPVEAMVTWKLHTANGAEYSKDLKSRIWPARGGWTGILETAPLKVALRGITNE